MWLRRVLISQVGLGAKDMLAREPDLTLYRQLSQFTLQVACLWTMVLGWGRWSMPIRWTRLNARLWNGSKVWQREWSCTSLDNTSLMLKLIRWSENGSLLLGLNTNFGMGQQKCLFFVLIALGSDSPIDAGSKVNVFRKHDHQRWRYHHRLLDCQSPYFQLQFPLDRQIPMDH